MRDPYDVLGVSRSASASDIKSAFRKLAKKLHPDANKHDPDAANRFAELNAAYEIAGDAAKRKAFDRGEIDAEGKPRFQEFEGFGAGRGGGFGGDGVYEFNVGPDAARAGRAGGGRGFGGFEDILKDVFSGMGAGRAGRAGAGGFQQAEPEPSGGGDVSAAVTITLPEVANGTKRRVVLPSGKEVEVKIPAGLAEGQQIRLKGQGLANARGRVGDVLITVSIAPHPLFERDGVDLRLELPITLYEAVLGGKVRVPTLDGVVELAIPAATSSGRTFRLKGKGLASKDAKGDLLATVKIVLPDRADPELEALMQKWREATPYDPRRDIA